ncbi:ATP-dependent DNA ligase [Aeromicrobium sp. IC_218]|uniref:ATP-dependent DNA ligase n=1 Tax=Aeromicrobium sp. IC_218 TaxID=2545468 RepID=UPI00103AB318|nr:ATP-dependent DNA ligase [Aeromicrobium sp. IC_218]TCJ00076.1 ATP-dependent DNA ligase [Aeromicrobium sp. IC_218]
MLLARLVQTSAAVAATRSRVAKRTLLAAVLAEASEDDVATVASYLAGSATQRRTGVGWRGLTSLPDPALEPTLTVDDVVTRLDELAAVAGSGSRDRRRALVDDLFARATPEEQTWLVGLLTGELRQGALDSLVLDAVAEAADVPASLVRRAAMLGGGLTSVAHAALTGGTDALEAFALEPGRPVLPMLAASATDVPAAVAKAVPEGRDVVVDAKLDGIRVQVHRVGDEVRVYTRSLDDVTERVPEVVETVAALDVTTAVLDGEAIALRDDGSPRPFQETGARTASRTDLETLRTRTPLTTYVFDVLHLDGEDLLDRPLAERLDRLRATLPASAQVPRVVTSDPAEAEAFFRTLVAAGHEGVVVKDPEAPYEAGRRGSGWVKVKPVHTLDLVVLGVERGSGRRSGLLSNIHLGARDGDGFVMLGKTFKGMTDETLAWQTERFRELATDDDGYTVTVRPEQVVEIAFDGVQRSTRYPGGLALRFARVVRYRDDKTSAEADTLETVRTFLG